MAAKLPERLLWALEILSIEPSDRLLELGCGQGAIVAPICKRLVTGTITAVDQSEKAIQIALRNNAELVSAGKASFLVSEIRRLDLTGNRFDKIFAFNVNQFWMDAKHELEAIKDLMTADGTLYIFNQPPAEGKIERIAERTSQNLIDAGYRIKQVVEGDLKPVPGICVIAEREV